VTTYTKLGKFFTCFAAPNSVEKRYPSEIVANDFFRNLCTNFAVVNMFDTLNEDRGFNHQQRSVFWAIGFCRKSSETESILDGLRDKTLFAVRVK
jgi:hypothetical protein